ncbi:hypothetical protein Acsp04_65220 [Actinomadura sp. NBRC 104425]|nr:hypothetical protein Acsp04_65220 [Actinomadura sp. NBRC 104425]
MTANATERGFASWGALEAGRLAGEALWERPRRRDCARMTLQFTWQGYDSALAAPLVLDLARLVAAPHAAGRAGPLPEPAYFFKDPIGATTHDLAATRCAPSPPGAAVGVLAELVLRRGGGRLARPPRQAVRRLVSPRRRRAWCSRW